VFVEGLEQALLGLGDGLGVERGDFGRGARLLGSAFGLGGEEGAIALGVRVAFGDGCGDLGGAGVGGARGLGWGGLGGFGAAAEAMRGEAFGHLGAQGLGGYVRWRRFGVFCKLLPGSCV
jgi:hypothetical protein